MPREELPRPSKPQSWNDCYRGFRESVFESSLPSSDVSMMFVLMLPPPPLSLQVRCGKGQQVSQGLAFCTGEWSGTPPEHSSSAETVSGCTESGVERQQSALCRKQRDPLQFPTLRCFILLLLLPGKRVQTRELCALVLICSRRLVSRSRLREKRRRYLRLGCGNHEPAATLADSDV